MPAATNGSRGFGRSLGAGAGAGLARAPRPSPALRNLFSTSCDTTLSGRIEACVGGGGGPRSWGSVLGPLLFAYAFFTAWCPEPGDWRCRWGRSLRRAEVAGRAQVCGCSGIRMQNWAPWCTRFRGQGAGDRVPLAGLLLPWIGKVVLLVWSDSCSVVTGMQT